ncbi:MAG: AGE family epimerase/isomerase [Pseudomonadota bacterium]
MIHPETQQKDQLYAWWQQCLEHFCDHGWNEATGLLHEKLDAQGVGTGAYHRALVHARLLYVYSYWGNNHELGGDARFLTQARRIYNTLIHHFYDHQQGGWVFALKGDGKACDTPQQLYTQAFVLFGLTSYYQHFADESAKYWIDTTIDAIEGRFLRHDGLYHARLNGQEAVRDGQIAQHPMMHLLEAYLLHTEVFSDTASLGKANILARTVCKHFLYNGFLLEHIDNNYALHAECGALCEPGHQFEWAWLLHWLMRLDDHDEFAKTASRLTRNGLRHGWDTSHGGIYDSVDAAKRKAITTDKRLWPITELLKITHQRPDYIKEFSLSYNDILAFFCQNYLRGNDEGFWHEWLRDDLSPRRLQADDYLMPASSLYHISMALAEQ